MFWVFMMVIGLAFVLFQLGALKVWVVVFQLALWAVGIIAMLLGVGLIWQRLNVKKLDAADCPTNVLHPENETRRT